jgi:hypothetical protein
MLHPLAGQTPEGAAARPFLGIMRRLLLMLLLAATSISTLVAAAPQTPRNLSAAVTGNTVTLTWQAPSTGSAPLGYLVEAALAPGGAIIAAFLVVDTSIVLAGVPNGVYYARVRSGNAEGISAVSAEVMVSVPNGGPCLSPPNAPTNLTASVSNTLVTLNWLAPAGACAETAYVVQAGSATGLSDLASFNVGSATTLSVVAPPGAYFVRVVAVNACGSSAASNELMVIAGDLTGLWSGTSDYHNAPFQFNLSQRERLVFGPYQDQHDSGAAFGQLSGNRIRLDVNLGDTGIRYEGTIETANRIRGTLWVPLGGRTYPFEMTR